MSIQVILNFLMKLKSISLMFIIIMISFEAANAQQHKLDSLLRELNTHKRQNEIKINILNQLADTYSWKQCDSGIVYANQAIELAIKLKRPKELAEAYNNKAKNLMYISFDSSTENVIKKSFEINKRIHNWNGMADNYLSFAIFKLNIGDFDSCKIFLHYASKLYTTLKSKDGLAFTNLFQGLVLLKIMDSTAGIKFKTAIELFTETQNVKGLGLSYDGIGTYYSIKSDTATASSYFNKAISLDKKNNIVNNLALDYSNIALLYLNSANYPRALDFALKGLRLSEQGGSLTNQAYCLNIMASIYLYLGNYPLALRYCLKENTILEKNNIIQFLSLSYCTTGSVYILSNKTDSGFIFLKKALEVSIKSKDSSAQAVCYGRLGHAQLEVKDYKNAYINSQKCRILYLKLFSKSYASVLTLNIGRCISLASDDVLKDLGINKKEKNNLIVYYFKQAIEENPDFENKSLANLELSKFYEQQNDVKKSFAHYKLYILYLDSVKNIENTKSFNNTQTQYETEKMEQKIALLNKDKALQQNKIDHQKTMRRIYIASIFLILLSALITLNRYMVKQKLNKQLALNLDALKFTQNQLIENEKLASLGQLTAGIAHEIKNPLNFVNNFSELSNELIEELKTLDNEEERKELMLNIKENLSKINHHRNRAERIVNGMMLHSRESLGERVATNINSLCYEVLDLAYKNNLLKFPEFTYELKKELSNDLPKINCVREDLSRVILNLLDNAFYAVRQKAKIHTPNEYKPIITISTELENNFISISIKDNGIGISDMVKQKIFEPFYTTKPTGEGTGLGLSICNDIIKAHFGNLRVESELGIGTSFVISLPVS